MRQWVCAGEIVALGLPGLGSLADVESSATAQVWPGRDVGTGRHRRRWRHVPGLPVEVRVALVRNELRQGDPSALLAAAEQAAARGDEVQRELHMLRDLAASELADAVLAGEA